MDLIKLISSKIQLFLANATKVFALIRGDYKPQKGVNPHMNQMKLSDFVSQTISELIDGVQKAQEYAKEKGARVNPQNINWSDTKKAFYSSEGAVDVDQAPYLTPIEFEVAVTIAQDDKAKGGIGIFAASFGIGVQDEVADRQESLNRIKFQILAKLPQQE